MRAHVPRLYLNVVNHSGRTRLEQAAETARGRARCSHPTGRRVLRRAGVDVGVGRAEGLAAGLGRATRRRATRRLPLSCNLFSLVIVIVSWCAGGFPPRTRRGVPAQGGVQPVAQLSSHLAPCTSHSCMFRSAAACVAGKHLVPFPMTHALAAFIYTSQ